MPKQSNKPTHRRNSTEQQSSAAADLLIAASNFYEDFQTYINCDNCDLPDSSELRAALIACGVDVTKFLYEQETDE